MRLRSTLLSLLVVGLAGCAGEDESSTWKSASGFDQPEATERCQLIQWAEQTAVPGTAQATVIAELGEPQSEAPIAATGEVELVYPLGACGYAADFQQLVVVMSADGEVSRTTLRDG